MASIIVAQIPLDHVWYKGLLPEGGASGFGEAICHYVKHNHANLLVMGNRGQGDFERWGLFTTPWVDDYFFWLGTDFVSTCRAMSAVVGLGSVSDYAVHNAPCPVMVFKN